MGGNPQPDGVRADAATAAHLASFAHAQRSLESFTAPVLLDEGSARSSVCSSRPSMEPETANEILTS